MENARDQPQAGLALIFARRDQFSIQEQAELIAQEFESHQAVIELDAFLFANLDSPAQTLRTTAVVAATNLMAIDSRQPPTGHRRKHLITVEPPIDMEQQ